MYNINFDKISEYKEYIETLVPITYDYTIKYEYNILLKKLDN